jgi:hypothetical protein
MSGRFGYRYYPPVDAGADKACRLTDETRAAREQPPETFFARAAMQEVLPNGYELRFEAGADASRRIDAFIAEEQQCCPFFAFERWRDGDQHVLRILRVEDDPETAEV